MSFWQRLFGRKRFRRFPDSFTLSQKTKAATLRRWIDQQLRSGHSVLVLSHFPSTFHENQRAVQATGLDYEILAEPVNESKFVTKFQDWNRDQPAPLVFSMAPMLIADHPLRTPEGESKRELSVIVTERYPIAKRDEQLEKFFRQTGLPVSMGYLMSFDDAILNHMLGERFINLMKQLGLGESHLVSSAMTDRALSRYFQKASESLEDEQPAESPDEWIRLNLDKEAKS